VRARVNLEVKAVDPDPEATAQACLELGAADAGLLRQRDTYFAVRSGRLKLREDLGEGAAELIYYERPSVSGVRRSTYRRIPLTAPAEVREVLSAALGVRGVVEKTRRLFLFENVRIHLDEVARLGTFVELEAVLASPAGTESREERAALSRVVEALRIHERETAAGSYVDLLAQSPSAQENRPASL